MFYKEKTYEATQTNEPFWNAAKLKVDNKNHL